MARLGADGGWNNERESMSDWDGGSDSPYGYWEGDTWIRTDAPTSTPVSSAPAWVPPPPPPPPPPAPEPVWTPPPEPAPAPVYAPPPAPSAPARNDLIWNQVNDVYLQELGRAADPSGQQNFYNVISGGGMSLDQMRNELRASQEYANLHPQTGALPVSNPSPPEQYSVQVDPETGMGTLVSTVGGAIQSLEPIKDEQGVQIGWRDPNTWAGVSLDQLNQNAIGYAPQTIQLYETLLGRTPSQSEINNVDELMRSNTAHSFNDIFSMVQGSQEYQNKSLPFLSPDMDVNTRFTSGANYYNTQGYIPAGNYEGVPTAYYDNNGNLIAWFGNIGTSTNRSNVTDKYTWHTPAELSLLPDAVPVTAHERPEDPQLKSGLIGAGSILAAVLAPELIGYLSPAAGATVAAGAGAGSEIGALGAGAGSLTEGITPAMVAAYEGALPTAVPSWLTSAAQSAGINAAVTAATGGSPQDILKSAGVGALGTALGGALSGYLNAGTIGDIVAKSAASAATAAATGGNPAAAALNVGMASALSSVIPSITSTALSGLPESVQKAINTSVSSSIIAAIRGGDVSTAALMGAASSALSSLGSTIANSAPVQEFKSQLKDAFNNITSSVSESLTPTSTTGGALTSAAENPYSAENILAALESGYLNAPQYTWGSGQQFAGLGVTAATPEQIAELARYGITLPQVGGETNALPTQQDVSNITIPEVDPTNQDLPMVDLTQSNVPHFTEGYPDLPKPELETWSQVMDSIYGASSGSQISQESINNIGKLVKEGVASGEISPTEASSAGSKIIANSNLLNVTPDVAITAGLIGYDGTFTPSGLEKALKEAGFSDDEIKNITGAGTETDTTSTEASTTTGSGTGENEGEGTGAGTAGGTGLGLTVGDGTGTGLGTGTSAGTGTGAGTGTTGLSTGYSYPSRGLLIGNAPSGGALPGSLQATYLKGADVKDYNPFENYNVYQQLAPINAAEGGSPLKLAQMQQSVSGIDPRLFSILQQRQAPSYFTYGSEPQSPTQFAGSQLQGRPSPQIPLVSNVDKNLQYLYKQSGASGSGQLGTPSVLGETMMKDGGNVHMNEHGEPHIPEFITGKTGHYVKGRGDGQSDDIPAMLADSEYVFDADTVAALGNGSSDAGAAVLDKMREAIRAHKRSAPVDEIPPPAKSPLEYLKDGLKGKRK